MRSFRFLLSRRWVLFTVAVAILAYGTWWLGDWQWGRLESKHHSNAIITAHLKQSPEPVTDVLSPGSEVGKDTEWTHVSATGTYDTAHTITWRYRTNDHSEAGVDIVVPLIITDGTGVLVDRGFLKSQDQDNRPVAVPAPPSGEVTVTGWVRSNAAGDSTRVSGLGTRALSSTTIGPAIGRDLLGGWVELQSESPAPDPTSGPALGRNDLPELGDGPHFFYALQWWFFGLLAVGGFFYLMYDERRLYLHAPAAAAARDPDNADAKAASETVTAVRAAASDARKARQREKNARKQALAAAYAKAREADDATRTKAFGARVERTKHRTDA